MNIKYLEILTFLNDQSIHVETKLKLDDYFDNLNSINSSDKNNLTFFSNIKYKEDLKKTRAKACLITKDHAKFLPSSCVAIIVKEPYLVFAMLTKLFFKKNKHKDRIISKNVFIHKDTIIKKNVGIDCYSYIDEKTTIMENVIIGSNSKIGPNVEIQKNVTIDDNVSISNSIIMENSEIKSGARIGGSGFGFEEKNKQKIFHQGMVKIGKNCSIGSNTTIDRAVFDATIIGDFSQIDNLVQIAHNVIIGKHAIIAAQVGIAGSTIIGDYVKIGGQVGIAGHLELGNNVTIAGKSGVTKNIEDNKIIAGFPAKDIIEWKRDIIRLNSKK